MRDRLEWSDVKLLHSILLFIDTQGWQVKSSSTDTGMSNSDDGGEDNLDGIKSAMESITSAFRVPLEAKGVNLSSLHDEIEEHVDHARITSLLTRYATRKSGTSYIPHLILANGQTFS